MKRGGERSGSGARGPSSPGLIYLAGQRYKAQVTMSHGTPRCRGLIPVMGSPGIIRRNIFTTFLRTRASSDNCDSCYVAVLGRLFTQGGAA